AKAAVRVEQGGRGGGHVLASHDEQRDPGAVFGGIEMLLHGDAIKVECKLGRRPYAARSSRHVVAVDGGRRVVAGEYEEGFVAMRVAAKPAGTADSGQGYFAISGAIQPEAQRTGLGVHEIGHDQTSPHLDRVTECAF